MTGMFQSSSTASGRPRLQISSAFSPSSASTIWKSNPSRMRRATFRITLESSTTRHVLIVASYFPAPLGDIVFRQQRGLRRLGCHQIGRELEHAIYVEDDHEMAV